MGYMSRLARRGILVLEIAACVGVSRIGMGADGDVRTVEFKGVLSETRLGMKELGLPTDWAGFNYLVMEMRTSSPQRFGLWIYTEEGVRRIEIQPFGEGLWCRACIPLEYLRGQVAGGDLAAATNRRTNSFWMSVWGPWGELKDISEIGLSMDYPINEPKVEIRNLHLSKTDEGSEFLEGKPVLDEFGQWAKGDWDRKIHSKEQLAKELADEAAVFGSGADFGYDKFGGYAATTAKGTGFFRVERIDGKWWFVDPDGHLYLSTGANGTGNGAGRRGGPAQSAEAVTRMTKRLVSWGMTTGGQGQPNTVMLNWPRNQATTYLGLGDIYAEDFAKNIDAAADRQCTPQKNDPLVLGYFIGNEPPWDGRESELVDMILKGADTATKAKLKEFLTAGDTPKRRKEFIIGAFKTYLDTICAAIRKYDPNHLIIGTRYGGKVSDELMQLASVFDVCSINVYEYEPTKQVERAYRLTGRPVMMGEFHIGVPETGLGAGLVQAENQVERGKAYRYFMEQGASLDGFLGAHWFTWRDEPVLGRGDGENYNIGFVDVTDRPYAELVKAAKSTNARLLEVHSGKVMPFAEKPKASEVGTPSSPWDN